MKFTRPYIDIKFSGEELPAVLDKIAALSIDDFESVRRCELTQRNRDLALVEVNEAAGTYALTKLGRFVEKIDDDAYSIVHDLRRTAEARLKQMHGVDFIITVNGAIWSQIIEYLNEKLVGLRSHLRECTDDTCKYETHFNLITGVRALVHARWEYGKETLPTPDERNDA